MRRRILRLAVGTYRAVEDAPPWAWVLAGASVAVLLEAVLP